MCSYMCTCSLPVPAGPGEVRVEWSEEGEVHSAHDTCVLECGPHTQDHWPRHLQDVEVSSSVSPAATSTPNLLVCCFLLEK